MTGWGEWKKGACVCVCGRGLLDEWGFFDFLVEALRMLGVYKGIWIYGR